MLTLFELAGAHPQRRFSPFCWRSHLALLHKGLDFQALPWRYCDKDAIAFSGQGKVPVIRDGETVVSDSWEIARYLESTYPDPTLFPRGEAEARAFTDEVEQLVTLSIRWFLLPHIHGHLSPGDQVYFRRTREAQIGRPLEQADQQGDWGQLQQNLIYFAELLDDNDWFGGTEPGYEDLALLGTLLWAAAVYPRDPLAEQPVLSAWRSRLVARFGKLAGFKFCYSL
ncbi:glutathione S-transferase N-terminal domain-containing protein [Gallaecimonas sp. GXIMD4217]|uniref:glutathione S-transferase family protein n=1 Tax=Gallaecimonas sp. GXIMD4217 TaxID=3131927 RepID=UPI00311B167D